MANRSDGQKPDSRVLRYVSVHDRPYKCKIRTGWFCVLFNFSGSVSLYKELCIFNFKTLIVFGRFKFFEKCQLPSGHLDVSSMLPQVVVGIKMVSFENFYVELSWKIEFAIYKLYCFNRVVDVAITPNLNTRPFKNCFEKNGTLKNRRDEKREQLQKKKQPYKLTDRRKHRMSVESPCACTARILTWFYYCCKKRDVENIIRNYVFLL